MIDPTERFSQRVSNYLQYRPAYPATVIELLRSECRLTSFSVVADIGSGTGHLAKLFLDSGLHVYGIEPNREMREAGERILKEYPHFISVSGRAEATTLPDGSVDFVTAGQAFHWFDWERAREEFRRILMPDGWVVLIWNWRRIQVSPFLAALEELLSTLAPEYRQVRDSQLNSDRIRSFFQPNPFKTKILQNTQILDWDGLRGWLLSASYTPEKDHPNYDPLFAELERIYRKYQVDGRVLFEFDTAVYYGQLSKD